MIRARWAGYLRNPTYFSRQWLRMVESLQAENARLRRELRSRAARRLRLARARARRLGYRHGVRAVRREEQAQLLECHGRCRAAIEKADRDCLELAMTVAHEVAGAAVAVDRQRAGARVTELLGRLGESRSILVLVNGADVESTAAQLAAFDPPPRVEACEGVSSGNAIVQTEAGGVELDWEAQFELLRSHLFARLEKAQECAGIDAPAGMDSYAESG